MDYSGFLFIVSDHYDNTCVGNNLIVECKFNMDLDEGFENINHTTAQRMLSSLESLESLESY